MRANKIHKFDFQKTQGAHYTPNLLADFVASQIANVLAANHKKELRVLDPAIGDGVFPQIHDRAKSVLRSRSNQPSER